MQGIGAQVDEVVRDPDRRIEVEHVGEDARDGSLDLVARLDDRTTGRCGVLQAQARGEPDALHLAGRSLRDVIDEDDSVRHLEGSKPGRSETPKFCSAHHGVTGQYDGCRDVLTQARMWNGERGGVLDVGMREQCFLDLGRRDLLAAAVDDLLEAAGDDEIAVAIQHALIAGAEPPVDEAPRGSHPGCRGSRP